MEGDAQPSAQAVATTGTIYEELLFAARRREKIRIATI